MYRYLHADFMGVWGFLPVNRSTNTISQSPSMSPMPKNGGEQWGNRVRMRYLSVPFILRAGQPRPYGIIFGFHLRICYTIRNKILWQNRICNPTSFYDGHLQRLFQAWKTKSCNAKQSGMTFCTILTSLSATMSSIKKERRTYLFCHIK